MEAEKRTLLDDIEALHKQFERQKPPKKKRVVKEKKKLRRVNMKLKPLHMEQILDLRFNQHLSYVKIGKELTLKPETVYQALKRYLARGVFVDQRIFNGHDNPRHKISDDLRRRMLDRDLLQRWSGFNLSQRCRLLERDFDLKITPKSLQMFYRRNNVRYLAVGYIYAQALA